MILHTGEGCEVGPAPVSYQPALTPIVILAAHVLMGESISTFGPPRWLSGKDPTCQCGRHGFDPWVKKIPWSRKWQPTPVFLPGNSMDSGGWQAHGVHRVAKVSDTTEQLNNHLRLYGGCEGGDRGLPEECHFTLTFLRRSQRAQRRWTGGAYLRWCRTRTRPPR